MDLATLIGLGSGFALLFLTVVLGSSFWHFVNIPALFCVFGGSFAALLINFPLAQVMGMGGIIRHAFRARIPAEEGIIVRLVEFSIIARREGILALENHVNRSDDPFLARGINLAIDGTAPELIKDIMMIEIASMEDRHSAGVAVLEAAAVYGPAFGMIGTLIGLVSMLANLFDPSQIGPAMAVAILTTLYGAVQANLICLPLAGKLKVRTAMEVLEREIALEGILSIQSGDNPRIVEQKLKAFLAPMARDRIAIPGLGGG